MRPSRLIATTVVFVTLQQNFDSDAFGGLSTVPRSSPRTFFSYHGRNVPERGTGRGELFMARPSAKRMSKRWYPRTDYLFNDDSQSSTEREDEFDDLELRSIQLLAALVRNRLNHARERNVEYINKTNEGDSMLISDDIGRKEEMKNWAYLLAKGRFLDLTCSLEGEEVLENLFNCKEAVAEEKDVVRGAVTALQSLVIMGTQVGVTGSPKQLKKMVAHLRQKDNCAGAHDDIWDAECVKRLKFELDQTAGTQLLAELKRKRTTQGAFDLLVELGAWRKHEDLPLLRSGFPTRFTDEEEEAAKEAEIMAVDVDELLQLRKDFRREKVYTIDGASTSEIDDGLSLEVLTNDDGSVRQRFWIHIADADRWAPRNSKVFKAAQRRATSIYLPTGSVSMFPTSLSTKLMSLRANHDACSLSLGVELLPDGSIDTSSIIITPSLVRVSYRLTYDEVDEMLEEGVGYSEEWQLGAMLAAATKRRAHRIQRGSTEGMMQNPIPQASVSATSDPSALDGISISVNVDVTHNAGMNRSMVAEDTAPLAADSGVAPVSPAFLLVTEMMILAGEALGKWKAKCDAEACEAVDGDQVQLQNNIELPFRGQAKPDFRSRHQEALVLEGLRESNAGGGYCYAWYLRRFFSPVRICENIKPHSGMGLDCYVQWTSPIRRFSDLQAHAAVKRYLRRKRINKLMREGSTFPTELTPADLGCYLPIPVEESRNEEGKITEYLVDPYWPDDKIDFKRGLGLVLAARPLQRKSQEYWMLEYISRMVKQSPEELSFECTILGCVDPTRFQYAIYVHELGLEHRYLSEIGALKQGQILFLKVASTTPRQGLLTFALSARNSRGTAAPSA